MTSFSRLKFAIARQRFLGSSLLGLVVVCAFVLGGMWLAGEVSTAQEATSSSTGMTRDDVNVPKGGRILSKEEMEVFTITYLEKFIEVWENPDDLDELYTDNAIIVRTLVKNGVEVRRTAYTGSKDLIRAVKSKRFIRKGYINVRIADVEGFSEEGAVYILFRQHFQTFSAPGLVAYEDQVFKMVRLKQQDDGNWMVDFEDTVAYRPGEYGKKRRTATDTFFQRFDKDKKDVTENITKLEVEKYYEPTPTPQPTIPMNPTPTPKRGVSMLDGAGFRFVVVHEVTLKPMPGTRLDVVGLRGETIGVAITDDNGAATVPYSLFDEQGILDAYVKLNKFGFEEREIFIGAKERTSQEEIVVLGLSKPLKVEQLHTAKSGETLPSISSYFYGSREWWPELLAVNNSTIVTTDNLAGKSLRLPSITELRTTRESGFEVYLAAGPESSVDSVSTFFFGAPTKTRSASSGNAVEQISDTSAISLPVAPDMAKGQRLYRVRVEGR